MVKLQWLIGDIKILSRQPSSKVQYSPLRCEGVQNVFSIILLSGKSPPPVFSNKR